MKHANKHHREQRKHWIALIKQHLKKCIQNSNIIVEKIALLGNKIIKKALLGLINNLGHSAFNIPTNVITSIVIFNGNVGCLSLFSGQFQIAIKNVR